jgi:predicted chitinase
MNLFTGVVENRKDPLRLGRCQVRIVGVHTHDKTILPTDDLPWAFPMQPISSAAISGIGTAPVGVVEGTWVILMFRDEQHQQPIILGTLGGIPQEENKPIDSPDEDSISIDKVAKSSNEISQSTEANDGPTPKREDPQATTLTSGSGSTVTDGNGNPITTGTSTTAPAPAPATKPTSYPSAKGATIPPPASSKKGIDALNKAMTAAGFNGKYGRAALLAISGGECGWVPQNEGHIYKKPEALTSTFNRTFKNNPQAVAKYTNWQGSKKSFFDFVYSPENNGKLVGNTQADDGGKYYGKGFIQLTGRPNYTKYARLSGVNILDNPDLLNDDYDASARVAVAYFIDRVKVSTDDPSYLEKALPAVGNDAGGGYDKKRAYYRYFLGEAIPPSEQTDKSTTAGEASQGVPVAANGLPEDRQRNLVEGFRDPNMKYPLRAYIGEPDTNRLARGKFAGTIVDFKDQKKMTGVVTAGGVTWDQPNVPYNAQYPYNKITESESGHVVEIDDTPENERIHLYHRRGTFLEIDANGTQVNRIVGDGYHIIERNGYIFIGGAANVTVSGTCNVLVQGDANVDITGDTKVNMAGKADFNVAADMSINVGGELKIKAANIKIDSTSDFNVTTSADTKISSGGSFNSDAAGANNLTSGGNFEVNAAGRANIEGSTVHWASGAASATSAESAGLGDAIAAGEKSTQVFEPLAPPARGAEEDFGYETPEENEGDPNASKEYHDNRPTAPNKDSPKVTPPADGQKVEKPNNDIKPISTDCAVIMNMASFPESYVLHKDSTGYSWTVGAITKKNSLTAGTYGLGLGRGSKAFTVQEIVCNMKALCVNILGPLNESIGGINKTWSINSGYRNYIPTGGSATSHHLIGSAVDLSAGGNFGYKTNFDLAKKISEILPYDQLLLEYRDRNDGRINWVHVAYNNYGTPKKDLRTFLNDKTHTAGSLVYLGK